LTSDPSAGHGVSFGEGDSGYPMVVSSSPSVSAVGSSQDLNEIPTRSVSIDVVPYQSFGSRYQRLAADDNGALDPSASRRTDETGFEPVEPAAETVNRKSASNRRAEFDDDDDEGETATSEGGEDDDDDDDGDDNDEEDNEDDRREKPLQQQQQKQQQSPHPRRSIAKSTRREVMYREEDPDEDLGGLGTDGIELNNEGNEEEEEEEEVDTRQVAKMGYRRRKKIKPKVIIVKKILPLSTTTFRG
jgi:hypothetical protein